MNKMILFAIITTFFKQGCSYRVEFKQQCWTFAENITEPKRSYQEAKPITCHDGSVRDTQCRLIIKSDGLLYGDCVYSDADCSDAAADAKFPGKKSVMCCGKGDSAERDFHCNAPEGYIFNFGYRNYFKENLILGLNITAFVIGCLFPIIIMFGVIKYLQKKPKENETPKEEKQALKEKETSKENKSK